MFAKFLFRMHHRHLESLANPYKALVEESSFLCTKTLLKKIEKERIGEYLEELDNTLNEIDEYGDKQYPKEPPFAPQEFKRIKRIVLTNLILTFLFIFAEGAFNYLAASAFIPEEGLVYQILRILIAIVIALLAYKAIDTALKAHYDYIPLRNKSSLTESDRIKLVTLKFERRLYFAITFALFLLLFSLGIVREFVFAGGEKVDVWLLIVTISAAILVAVLLGIQGEKSNRVIDQYYIYRHWQRLRKKIDRLEVTLQGKFDRTSGKFSQAIENEWGWIGYTRRWLVRNYDEDDQNKSEEEKKNLLYINKDVFKKRIYLDAKEQLDKLKEHNKKYEKLKDFYPPKPIGA